MMKEFVRPKSTLIIANGEQPDQGLLDHYRHHATKIIALDGATQWLLTGGIIPDLVVGDFDSISIEDCKDLPVHHCADQESNDLAKALAYCVEHHLSEVIVLGAFGLRADHFLTNVHVMHKFSTALTITLIDRQQIAFICPTHQPVVFDDCTNAFLSLFPLADTVGPISTHGVAYPLAHEHLSLHSRVGTLNRITHERASLTCAHKDLLVIMANCDHEPYLSDNTVCRGMKLTRADSFIASPSIFPSIKS